MSEKNNKNNKNNKKKKKNSQMIIRINDEERAEFIALCEALDTSAAREVRRFIRDFIALNGEGQSDENIKLKSE